MEASAVNMLEFENRAFLRGYRRVAGIDEAGRGPLAGPVVAAAVVLPLNADLKDVKDSKQLSPSRREACYERILSCARGIGIGCVESWEIDRTDILRATFQAMIRAVEELTKLPDCILIDGPYTLPLDIAQLGIPQGDRKSLSIAAASIIAKVHRDRLMTRYHLLYPEYGFDQHKGYPTRKHLANLTKYGASPIHRLSFKGVKPSS